MLTVHVLIVELEVSGGSLRDSSFSAACCECESLSSVSHVFAAGALGSFTPSVSVSVCNLGILCASRCLCLRVHTYKDCSE